MSALEMRTLRCSLPLVTITDGGVIAPHSNKLVYVYMITSLMHGCPGNENSEVQFAPQNKYTTKQ